MDRGARPAVAIATPYWSFWAHTVGPDLREERLDIARSVARRLEPAIDVLGIVDFASPDEAVRAATTTGRRLDALLLVQTMAVPPSFTLAWLDAIPAIPLVIWGLDPGACRPDQIDHAAITARGATVGVPMLTNVLTRRGHPFEVILGRLDDEVAVGRITTAVRTAAAAGRIGRARLGRVGGPQEGYLHVDVDDVALHEATGISLVRIPPEEFAAAYRSVPDRSLQEQASELRELWDVAPDVDPDTLERSVRCRIALAQLSSAYELDGGAFNCHVPSIRLGDEIGIAPCWALGEETSAGRPWTCTGDVLTAVAMQATKRLGGAALYHELELADHDTGEMVIANSGEHDLAWLAAGARPRLQRNGWFCGTDARCGACAAFEPDPGPATIVGFTPHPQEPSGFRFVVASGELTDRTFPGTGTVNGAFRFAGPSLSSGWERWVTAGVNHHSSATPGSIAEDVAALARHLHVGCVIV